MNRRGLALLATLWLVVGLTGVSALALTLVQRSIWTARNRIWLMRTGWAREACWSIVLGRFETKPSSLTNPLPQPLEGLPRTDLGAGVWCGASWEHPERQLNLNTATPEMLQGLVGEPSRVAALLDWRDADDIAREQGAEAGWYLERRRPTPRNAPLAAVEELHLVRGFDSALVSAITPLVTVRGSGRLDVNSAPLRLVALLPGIGPEAVAAVEDRRSGGRRLNAVTDLLGELSASARLQLLSTDGELARLTTVDPDRLWLRLTAGIEGIPLVSESRMGIALAGDHLAVIEVEAP